MKLLKTQWDEKDEFQKKWCNFFNFSDCSTFSYTRQTTNSLGAPVAQLVERASSEQKLCPHCSDRDFCPTCGPWLRETGWERGDPLKAVESKKGPQNKVQLCCNIDTVDISCTTIYSLKLLQSHFKSVSHCTYMSVMASKIWYWLARYFGECKKKKSILSTMESKSLFYSISSSPLSS